MFLWIVIIVTLASLNAPYSVPTFFQTFLGTRDHLEPMISVYTNFRPILGTPWLQIWPFIEWKSDQSGLVLNNLRHQRPFRPHNSHLEPFRTI